MKNTRIALFDAKPYDKRSFEKYNKKHEKHEEILNSLI